jgi:hypothetical protein
LPQPIDITARELKLSADDLAPEPDEQLIQDAEPNPDPANLPS